MIIGRYFVKFESYIYIYIYMKITKLSNVNPYLFFVMSSPLVVRSNVEPKYPNASKYSRKLQYHSSILCHSNKFKPHWLVQKKCRWKYIVIEKLMFQVLKKNSSYTSLSRMVWEVKIIVNVLGLTMENLFKPYHKWYDPARPNKIIMNVLGSAMVEIISLKMRSGWHPMIYIFHGLLLVEQNYHTIKQKHMVRVNHQTLEALPCKQRVCCKGIS